LAYRPSRAPYQHRVTPKSLMIDIRRMLTYNDGLKQIIEVYLTKPGFKMTNWRLYWFKCPSNDHRCLALPNHCRDVLNSVVLFDQAATSLACITMMPKVFFLMFLLPAAAVIDFDFAPATYLHVNVSEPLSQNLRQIRILRDLSERQICTTSGYSVCSGFPASCCPSGGRCCNDGTQVTGQCGSFRLHSVHAKRLLINCIGCCAQGKVTLWQASPCDR
jgi:hypothetical protein